MASILKRRKRYMVNYRDATGTQRQPSFRTRREADRFMATVLTDRQQPTTPAVDPEITVATYAERWLGLITPTLKSSSIEGYRQKLDLHVLPAFRNVKVRQLQRGRIKALLAEKLASGLAPDSVRLIHATIRAMLNAAVDDGVILANPSNKLGKVLRLVRPKATRQEEIKAFDRDQLSRFLSAALSVVPRLYPLFLTLARAGLRVGEAFGLQWDDLDFATREVHVERAVSTTGEVGTPKSGHGRTVDMSTSLRDVLQRHRSKLQAEALKRGAVLPAWAFPSDAGTPMDHANVGKAFRRVLKAAALPLHFHPHCLRHTFASLLLQQGESIYYVQRMLGQSPSPATPTASGSRPGTRPPWTVWTTASSPSRRQLVAEWWQNRLLPACHPRKLLMRLVTRQGLEP